jgi:hypothetical protein
MRLFLYGTLLDTDTLATGRTRLSACTARARGAARLATRRRARWALSNLASRTHRRRARRLAHRFSARTPKSWRSTKARPID